MFPGPVVEGFRRVRQELELEQVALVTIDDVDIPVVAH